MGWKNVFFKNDGKLIITKGLTMMFKTIKHFVIVCVVFMIVCLTFYTSFMSGCKLFRPLFNMSGSPGRLDGGYSRETVNGREYYVSNSYFCPAYFDGEDWGIVVLAVADVTDREVLSSITRDVNWATEFQPYHITSTNTSKQTVDLLIGGKNVTCQYEKDVVIVCYNDESGNCYSARLEMDDPRVACLFYGSGHKKRTEIIDLWYQLNEEKDKHTILFEASLLPERGANRNRGKTQQLYHAGESTGDDEAVRLLLEAGAFPSTDDQGVHSPAVSAASAGRFRATLMMLEAGAEYDPSKAIGKNLLTAIRLGKKRKESVSTSGQLSKDDQEEYQLLVQWLQKHGVSVDP